MKQPDDLLASSLTRRYLDTITGTGSYVNHVLEFLMVECRDGLNTMFRLLSIKQYVGGYSPGLWLSAIQWRPRGTSDPCMLSCIEAQATSGGYYQGCLGVTDLLG